MCSTEMAPQQGIGSAVLSNSGGDVLIRWDLRDIRYQVYGFELLCGSPSGEHRRDAHYRGTTRLSATGATGAPIDFTVSG